RWDIWYRGLRAGWDAPWTGTGYGTFRDVEPVSRRPGDGHEYYTDHAHNDYVEAFTEGGGPRLVLTLLLVGLVDRLGARAYRRYQGHGTADLVLGGVAGFTAVAVHSFLDFGLHTPAITVLATVLAAVLAGLGGDRQGAKNESPAADRLRLFGVAPVLAAVVLVGLGWVLGGEGWRGWQAERFRAA